MGDVEYSKPPRPERPKNLPCQQVAGKACLRGSAVKLFACPLSLIIWMSADINAWMGTGTACLVKNL